MSTVNGPVGNADRSVVTDAPSAVVEVCQLTKAPRRKAGGEFVIVEFIQESAREFGNELSGNLGWFILGKYASAPWGRLTRQRPWAIGALAMCGRGLARFRAHVRGHRAFWATVAAMTVDGHLVPAHHDRLTSGRQRGCSASPGVLYHRGLLSLAHIEGYGPVDCPGSLPPDSGILFLRVGECAHGRIRRNYGQDSQLPGLRVRESREGRQAGGAATLPLPGPTKTSGRAARPRVDAVGVGHPGLLRKATSR